VSEAGGICLPSNGISGGALANAAARHAKIRERGACQHPSDSEVPFTTAPAVIKNVIQIMEQNLKDPLANPAICKQVGSSHRQVMPVCAPRPSIPDVLLPRYRLERARGLVTQTDLSMSEISVVTGFFSQVHCGRAYKERSGQLPIKDSVEGCVAFEFRSWPVYRKPGKNQQARRE